MKEFISCRFCGKIVNARSNRCHHCGGTIQANSSEDEDSSTEPFAEGGYDHEADDFDFDEFVESEFGSGSSPKRTLWHYIAWLMIVVLLLPVLISLLYAIGR